MRRLDPNHVKSCSDLIPDRSHTPDPCTHAHVGIYIVFISLMCVHGGAMDHHLACLDITESARHRKDAPYFFLPPAFFSALASLGAAGAAASFLLSFLPGMLCLLGCVESCSPEKP
jgi:hypothetical protein